MSVFVDVRAQGAIETTTHRIGAPRAMAVNDVAVSPGAPKPAPASAAAPAPPPPPAPPAAPSAALQAELKKLIAEQQYIVAIKRAREDLNLGLKEAKDLVDALRGA